MNWLNNGNVERTIEVIGKLANLMEQWINEGSIKAETLYGIELLNEPAGVNFTNVLRTTLLFESVLQSFSLITVWDL